MKKYISIALLGLLVGNFLSAQTTSRAFTTPGYNVFMPPPGVDSVLVEIFGAGGGGNPFNGNGGGSGAFTKVAFKLKGDGLVYTYVGRGGTSAKSGESSLLYWDSAGVKVLYGVAYGGSGINGQGGGIAPRYPSANGYYFGQRGGNASAWSGSYYGAGGGTPYNTPGDAPSATGSSCNIGGTSEVGGSGGNGDGPGCTKSNGTFPGGGGGSGPGTGASGANGSIEFFWICPNPSDIGISHTVPYPQEKNPDYLQDANGISPTGNGIIYAWEQSRDGITNWTPAPGSFNDKKYALPEDSIINYFRRVSNICDVTGYSNVVKINVVRKDTINALNPLGSFGSIQGRIISKGGNPVKGDSVWVRKVLDLNGSPKEYSYYDTTDGDGIFKVERIFYGKQSNLDGDPTDVKFYVMPLKYGHVFSKYSSDDTTNATLNSFNYDVELAPNQGNWTFKDLTAVTIQGRTYQQCDGCIPPIAGQLVQRDLDSVTIKVNDMNAGLRSGKTIDGAYGRFNYTVEDITQSYRFSPTYKNHRFDTTGNLNVIRTNRDTVLNLRDTTTFSISGTVRAGCNEIIGRATLQFSDIPQTPERNSVFFFNVTTQTNGNYIVRLPAGRYKVKMLSFTPAGSGADLKATNVINFFSGDSVSTAINPELLKVDISTNNATLNLIYQRPPTMQLIGWDSVCKTVYGEGFDVWKTLDTKPLQIKVFQGPVSKNCPLSFDSVKIFTTIQTDGVEEIFKVKVDTAAASRGIARDTLKVGVPNINGDFTKSLFITYVDQYGSPASISKKVVVTGSRARPGQTFETVSPLIPLMVVHDPPGDQSYARWKQTSTSERAMRFFVNSSLGTTIWAEAKVGAAFSAGVDIFGVSFSTDFAAWASVNASASIKARGSSQNELIVRTETSEEIKTADNSNGIGDAGDVFYGGALNLIYGTTDDILFSNCQVTKKSSAVFAPNKIMTTYRYSETDIKNTIANLRLLAQQTPARADSFNNQANVWQQVLDNNNRNKANATFIENKTFTGNIGSSETTISRSVTGSNTLEFAIEVNAGLAVELGLEVAGSGLKGGVMVNIQLEVGGSVTNTSTSATEISYLLSDKDAGDKYTVNVSRDPVYGTPVFKTLAGLSSCPPEENTIARDEMTIVTAGPSEINVPAPDKVTNFDLIVGNNSIDVGAKPYNLFVLDNDGATIKAEGVTIGGTSAFYGIQPIPQGGTQTINIEVAKRLGANSPFTYRNIKFIVTDICSNKLYEATVSRQQLVSVNFATTCSNINLTEPSDGWVLKASDQNKLNILFDGYTPSGLNTVVMQYRPSGTTNWIDATSTTKTAADLGGTTSYSVDWGVADLADGKYDIRMKLVCTSGIVYTKSVSGLMDRRGPSLFGIPDPTDGNFEPGDIISFSYDENIQVSDINNGSKVQMYRMSNNTLIPSTASGIGNKIIVTPAINLLQYLGDSVRVVVSDIYDMYGNKAPEPSITEFTIGTLPPVVSPAKPVKVYSLPASMYENVNGSLQVRFKMDVLPTRPIVKVNFTIGGNATFGTDYTVSIPNLKTIVKNLFNGINEEVLLVSSFNGSDGFIFIDSNKPEAIITITPVKDGIFEPDENIVINVTSGGDYSLSDSLTTTAVILNDDLQPPVIDSTGALTFCTGESVTLSAVTPNVKPRWASSVIRFSNQYSANEWGAKQALGAPDVYPVYGDIQYAWSPTNPDNAREFIELRFANAAPINFINIYETFNPGAIDTVYVKDPTGAWVRVYAENALPADQESRVLNIPIPITSFDVRDIRIALNSAAVPGFNEIDAVGIGLDTTYTSYLWSNGQTTKSIVVNQSGTYQVTVKNAVGQTAKSDSVKVVVIPPVQAITGPVKVCVGRTIQLSNVVAGGTWTSNKTNIATVSSTGRVTGISQGTVTIFYSTPPNAYGCTNVASVSITVNGLPAVASITGITSICLGKNTTLSNATTGGVWSSSDTSVAVISLAGVVKSRKAGTTTISYTTAPSGNGCTNTITTTVTVNALPAVGPITGPTNVCLNQNITLANVTTGGIWSSADTSIAVVNASTGVTKGKKAGTVNISYTTAPNAGGCTNVAVIKITVNPIPAPGTINGTKSICLGSTSALTNTLTGGVWSCSPVSIATISTSGVVSPVAVGSATVTYTVTGTGGCVKSVSTPISILGVPAVSSIVGTNNVCVGGQTTLGNATTGGTWSSSDTTKAIISSTGVVTGRAAGVITIIYTTKPNANGCTNKATLPFTVNGLPVLGNIVGTKTICANGSTQLTNTTPGGVWSCTPTTVATIDNAGLVRGVAAGSATVTYSVTSAAGCFNSINATIVVKGIPAVAAITGSNKVCVASTTLLSTTTTGGSWSSSNINLATVSSTGTVTGISAGNATITYTTAPNASGCTNATSLAVTINPLPPVSNITGTRTVCSGKTTKLSNTTTGGTWSSSDNTKATVSTTGLVTGVAAGSAVITYTTAADANGCRNKVSVTVTVTGPCAQQTVLAKGATNQEVINANTLDVNVSPNPTTQVFVVKVNAKNNSSISIRVTDVNGKTVYTTKGKPNQTFIFGEQLFAGTYMVEVRQAEEKKTIKLIKLNK